MHLAASSAKSVIVAPRQSAVRDDGHLLRLDVILMQRSVCKKDSDVRNHSHRDRDEENFSH